MEKWSQLWLAYHKVENSDFRPYLKIITVQGFARSATLEAALEELSRGVRGMLGMEPAILFEDCAKEEVDEDLRGNSAKNPENPGLMIRRKTAGAGSEAFTLLLTGSDQAAAKPDKNAGTAQTTANPVGEDGTAQGGAGLEKRLCLEAEDAKGILYGVFHVLRAAAAGRTPEQACGFFSPDAPLRMLNHWDNMPGDIERGYSGNSFFFRDGELLANERTKDYARLTASVGINAVVINNVNVKGDATWLITDRYYEDLARLAELLETYGIRLYLSLNFAAPMELGGLDTCDPLREEVVRWWEQKMEEVWRHLPSLGGFLVKADSEGRPGPFTYGRTQAEGANMLADAAAPFGGRIIWRCFVYNCQQDWRDTRTDRACAGYQAFKPLDGAFRENVILQIKNGPMDFQIREPVSPLLGGLTETNQMLEVQLAQEYTGQQIDVCYLVPMFREILEFRTGCGTEKDRVREIVCGETFGNKNAGFAAVANTGNDACWTGSEFAAANWYGFGRLAWDMDLDAEEIAREWAALTFAADRETTDTLTDILMHSRETYEKYTSPLGIGWMVTPGTHYGCSVDGYEYSRWGTYHRADHLAIGVDRSSRGTGYAQQYYPEAAARFDSPETCPEELLLFFHRVPYTYRLKNGKTLIQHIYDSHFEGFQEAEEMASRFQTLQGRLPEEVFENLTERFERQLENAREWRDQVNSYFFRKSGIADEKGREIF